MVRLVPNCSIMSRCKGDRMWNALFSKQMYNIMKKKHITNVRNLFCGKQYQITH